MTPTDLDEHIDRIEGLVWNAAGRHRPVPNIAEDIVALSKAYWRPIVEAEVRTKIADEIDATIMRGWLHVRNCICLDCHKNGAVRRCVSIARGEVADG